MYPAVSSIDKTELDPSIQLNKECNVNARLHDHEITYSDCLTKPYLKRETFITNI